MKLYFPLKASQVLYPPQDQSYLILKRQARGVYLHGTLWAPQGSVASASIGLIALFDTARLFLELARGRLPSSILE